MTTNPANGLPYHVVRKIQQHLLPPDIAKSKGVSREWNEAGQQVEAEKIQDKAQAVVKELINTLKESTIENAIKNPSPKQKSCFDILCKLPPFHRKQVNEMIRARAMLTSDQQAAVDYILQNAVQISHRSSADVKTRNHAYACRALVLGADPNHNAYGTPVLQWAALYDHTDTVQALLDSGADANMTDSMGKTALYRAICYGNTETVKVLLLKDSLDIHSSNNDGETALDEAIARNHTEIVKALLKAGANSSGKLYGKTNLAWAAINGNTEIAKILIAKGANTDVPDSMGKTALDEAISHGHTEIVELLENASHKRTLEAGSSR